MVTLRGNHGEKRVGRTGVSGHHSLSHRLPNFTTLVGMGTHSHHFDQRGYWHTCVSMVLIPVDSLSSAGKYTHQAFPADC
jgi:hypothetical protein